MPCQGTCTVRIFEARSLVAQSWPPYTEQATAINFLQGVVNQFLKERRESGCEERGCECVPLAAYFPDPATGLRQREPDWTVWRIRNVIAKIGEHDDLVFGTVEGRSAIVQGLCEEPQWDDLTPPRADPRKRSRKRPGRDNKKKRR